MSEPTALPLDESKLPFKIPKDTKPREKIMKLGQMITDRIPAKNRPCARQAAPPDGGGPRILGSGQHCD